MYKFAKSLQVVHKVTEIFSKSENDSGWMMSLLISHVTNQLK